jgi:hypothetical protein
MPFGFKLSLVLELAITKSDKLRFLQCSYELFLLLFRTQPDDPHRLVTLPFLLQCHPRILRSSDTSLAYSSSFPSRKHPQSKAFTLYCFHSLFDDHKRPNVIYLLEQAPQEWITIFSKNFSLLML